MAFVSVEQAIEDTRAGRMLVVVDDEDRENEGDLTLAAEKITPEIINFMATHGRGLICLTLTPARCEYLRLPLMTPRNTSNFGTAFCESIDAIEGVTTGISASDRANTILAAVNPATRASDLARPGHIFPLRAREGGVLVRAGQTEASVDLARLAGLSPSGVICEIMNEDGSMARVPQLLEYCQRHHLNMISVADLIRYRLQHERYIHRSGEGVIQTEFGEFRLISYASDMEEGTHLALVRGDVSGKENTLVRMHSHCVYGDVFGSTQCDCQQLIQDSLCRIATEGEGVLVYLHQTGPGIRSIKQPGGLDRLLPHDRENNLSANSAAQRYLQHDTGIGAQILSDLGLGTIRLLTNHPRKVVALAGFGIKIVEQVSVPARPSSVRLEKSSNFPLR